jgi:hypothetical protein
MSLAERFASALREQRILRHCRAAIAAQRAGDGVAARVEWQQMSQEIEARTPEQVARMERSKRLERRANG